MPKTLVLKPMGDDVYFLDKVYALEQSDGLTDWPSLKLYC